MVLTEVLEKKTESYSKESNDKIIKTINYLVDEFNSHQDKINSLLNEIEDTPIEDDFFFKNVKKEDFKKRALLLEERIISIEKKWSELIILLNNRVNKK